MGSYSGWIAKRLRVPDEPAAAGALGSAAAGEEERAASTANRQQRRGFVSRVCVPTTCRSERTIKS